MSNLEIRKAIDTDVDRIKQMDHLSHTEERANYIERVVAAGTAWVAVSDAEAVGYAVLDNSYFERLILAMLIVESPWRRRGIGEELVDYLEQKCDDPELWTSTNVSNIPMQRLLTKRGYLLTGFIDNLDPGDPELIYFKHLTPQ